MPIVKLRINNRSYEIECDDGEEKCLLSSAKKLDFMIKESTELKNLPESKMFLMTSILLAEESINKDLTNNNCSKAYDSLNDQLVELEKLVKEKC